MGTANVQGQIWGTRAKDWADVQESVAVPLFEAVLQEIAVGTNASVLDIGCGSGIFCEMAAKRGAQVSGLDASEPLLAIARERVQAGNFRTGEMEELPYADRAFDVVTGFNSFQFAADPVNALREASRVSRTGTVVIAVFGKPEENQSTAYIRAMGSLLPPPPPEAPGPFALSADGALEALAIKAGLTPATVKTVECPWNYPDEKTALRGLLSSGPAIRAIQNKGEEVVRDVVLQVIAPFKTSSGGYYLTNNFRYLIATA
ncbi:MAG: methyltransferase domain-containing protein [Chloroflexi bacterium]|nr:methyltransferase domain-containing protein [Chloroflexota bacterium]